jgi:hypothetical protein
MILKSKSKRARVGKARRKNFASDYGYARVRDKAFDAVHELWTRRNTAGVTLVDVAEKIGRDKGWLSKQMNGPGNWTLRTFGELVMALDGEAEIAVYGLEDPPEYRSNYNAYSANELETENKVRDPKVVYDQSFSQTPKSVISLAQSAKARMEFAK